jgi:uncharacterized protein (DUF924 family)
MTWIDEVLRFWFLELGPKDWFAVNVAVDEAIKARFGALYREVERTPPVPSALDARGHLAAVIVFDQFPRNLFRHTPHAFATDALALSFSLHAVEHGMDEGLGQHERQFLYMPFMHCENVAMQERSLELFTALDHADSLRSARTHKDIIDRFGRFPYRNQALGRVSTAAEEAFLKTQALWP